MHAAHSGLSPSAPKEAASLHSCYAGHQITDFRGRFWVSSIVTIHRLQKKSCSAEQVTASQRVLSRNYCHVKIGPRVSNSSR